MRRGIGFPCGRQAVGARDMAAVPRPRERDGHDLRHRGVRGVGQAPPVTSSARRSCHASRDGRATTSRGVACRRGRGSTGCAMPARMPASTTVRPARSSRRRVRVPSGRCQRGMRDAGGRHVLGYPAEGQAVEGRHAMIGRIRRAVRRRPRRMTAHLTASERRANRNRIVAAVESSDSVARYATFTLRG